MIRTFALVVMSAVMACSSDGPSSLRYGVSDPTATVLDEFDNGDVLLAVHGPQRRVRLNFTPATDELPGISCSWLRPARDGTEFVQCANTYVRTPGSAWERLAMPDEPSLLLGQAKDGTRYFVNVITHAIIAQLPGTATFAPVAGLDASREFHRIEVSSHGDFLVPGLSSVNVILGGVLGPPIPRPVYPPPSHATGEVSPLVDESGFIYISTATGAFDRYDLETGARDAAWFAPPAGANPSYNFLGVSSEGALFAISEYPEGALTGNTNDVELGNLMSRHHGNDEWQSAGEMFGLDYLFFEQLPTAWPGRDGIWWLQTCVANCAGNAGLSQKELVRWQPSGTASVPALPTAYEGYANIGFVIATGTGRFELTFDDGDCERIPGTDVFSVAYAVCRATGRHTATVVTKNESGAVLRRFSVKIDVAAPPATPVRPPRHRTLFEFNLGQYAYVGADGLLHAYTTGATPPDLVLAQPTGVIALSSENGKTSLLTADGAVYRWFYVDGQTLAATRMNVPPATTISGTFMVGTDGNVYRVVDGAQPVTGMSGVVSLDCETAGLTREFCTALEPTGRTWTFVRNGVDVIEVAEQAVDPMLAAMTRGGGLSRTNQWYHRIDDTAWLEPSTLIDFTGVTRIANQAGVGDFSVPTALMVTRGGEAWMSAFEGANNYGVSLPPGRKSIAIEPAPAGAFVWLDDGRVGYVSLPSVQMGGSGTGSGFAWTPLPITAKPPARNPDA